VRMESLFAVTMHVAVFWDMTVCRLRGMQCCVRGTYCPHHQNLTTRQCSSNKLSLCNTALCACREHTAINNSLQTVQRNEWWVDSAKNLTSESCVVYLVPDIVAPSIDQATSLIWPL